DSLLLLRLSSTFLRPSAPPPSHRLSTYGEQPMPSFLLDCNFNLVS
ncbi:hypothetical protein L195_g051717, partial [Trifolium pratense]